MPGIKRSARNQIWQSMRILRRFTIIDLCRTSGATRTNVRKFIRRLEIHGYVVQHGAYIGGQVGVFRTMRLVRDVGPQYPTHCEICGYTLGNSCEKRDDHE